MPAGKALAWTRRTFLGIVGSAPLVRAARSEEQRVRIVSLPVAGIQPQIAFSNDSLHLVYFSGDPRHGDLFYRRSEDFGQSFSSAIRVNTQPRSAIAIGAIRGAQIAIGTDDRVHVAWNGSDEAEPKGPINPDTRQPGSPMLYSRLNDRSTGFEPQRNLMQETFGLDGGGSVAADRRGHVYVAWHGKTPGARQGEAGRCVWIARSRDYGRTFTKEFPATQQPTGACGCCGMRLFADANGDVYGLYRSATENVHRDIYLLRSSDHGATFEAALLHRWNIDACPMSSMSLIQAGDEVLAAWETQTQIYFAPVAGGADRARAAMAAPPGENPKRKYPALARNRRGETLLAWVEGSGWARGGVLGWRIFDRSGRPALACSSPRNVPVWSFPAVFVRPDEGFTIIV